MADRCKQHGLALSPDGECVLCRRPPRPDAKPRSSLPRLVLLLTVLVAALSGLVWMVLGDGFVPRTSPSPPSPALLDPVVRIQATHPKSGSEELLTRTGFRAEEPYLATNETYRLILPPPGKTTLGALLFVPAQASGALPDPSWRARLAAEGLVYVGLENAGNERNGISRVRLALDALWDVMRDHSLEPSRLFISGLSGGGKSALRTYLAYPDVFSGVIAFAGADYFREIPASQHPGSRWPAHYGEPPGIARARTGRIALVTGTGDFNMGQVKDVASAMTEDGFVNVRLHVYPGLGHGVPSGETIHSFGALLGSQ